MLKKLIHWLRYRLDAEYRKYWNEYYLVTGHDNTIKNH